MMLVVWWERALSKLNGAGRGPAGVSLRQRFFKFACLRSHFIV